MGSFQYITLSLIFKHVAKCAFEDWHSVARADPPSRQTSVAPGSGGAGAVNVYDSGPHSLASPTAAAGGGTSPLPHFDLLEHQGD